MGNVILRFLLEGGHSLDVAVSGREATELMRTWNQESTIEGRDMTGREWKVDCHRILAAFTAPYNPQLTPPQQGFFRPGTSGLN